MQPPLDPHFSASFYRLLDSLSSPQVEGLGRATGVRLFPDLTLRLGYHLEMQLEEAPLSLRPLRTVANPLSEPTPPMRVQWLTDVRPSLLPALALDHPFRQNPSLLQRPDLACLAEGLCLPLREAPPILAKEIREWLDADRRRYEESLRRFGDFWPKGPPPPPKGAGYYPGPLFAPRNVLLLGGFWVVCSPRRVN